MKLTSGPRKARELLQRGIAASEFREMNVSTTAACLVGTVDSFVRAQAYLRVEYNLQEITDCITDRRGFRLRA